MNRIELPREQLEAVNRPRRIINQHDAHFAYYDPSGITRDAYVATMLGFAEWPGSQVDSVWWDIGESNLCCYQSDILQPVPAMKEWLEAGNDLLPAFVEESRARGLEVFISHRINGCDEALRGVDGRIAVKRAHPDWLLNWNPDPNGLPEHASAWDKKIGLWNFAVPEVRSFKLNVLRELAENYDLDGIQLDFARICPVLPIGHQWEHRESLTEFMRALRQMLLEVAQRRGRPFLLAAKVPENLMGCHFDGLDVETWADERLIDIFVLGCRSLEADIPSFRRITEGTHIKLYPSHDCHHASDAYKYPPLEVLRGICSNWWRQGADGIHIFNYLSTSLEAWKRVGLTVWTEEGCAVFQDCQRNEQALREIGSLETLRHKDKTFVLQRRAGGHPWIFGWPEDGEVQHYTYHNSNMLASLPAKLGRHGRGHTLLRLYAGDDVNADADRIASIELRILLSDPSAKDLPPDQCIKAGTARPAVYKVEDQDSQETIPISKQMLAQVEVRLNNIPLGPVTVEGGWLTFPVQPNQLAAGENLVGIRITGEHDSARDDILIERLELGVIYSKGSENP